MQRLRTVDLFKLPGVAETIDWANCLVALDKLALDPKNDKTMVGKDLEIGINALIRLGRNDEVDEFREAVIKVHEKNWRLLATAAHTYSNGEHYGFMVAGKFLRGGHRGGGRRARARRSSSPQSGRSENTASISSSQPAVTLVSLLSR